MLTQARVKELFDYHPDGYLFEKTKRNSRCKIGSIVGSIRKDGRYVANVDKKNHYVGRLIFLYHHGHMPEEINYIDCNHSNTAIDNLRASNKSNNKANQKKPYNNSSGFKGASWHKRSKSWQAKIRKDSRDIHLGYFPSAETAHEAYCVAAVRLFGEFSRF